MGRLPQPEDRRHGEVAAGIVEWRAGFGRGRVAAGGVDGGHVEFAGPGRALASMVAAHEGQPPRGEQAARAIERLQKVFGGDDGVVAAVAAHLLGQKGGVVGIGGRHLFRPHQEDAAHAVEGLGRFQLRLLGPQEVGRGVHGSQIDGCGAAGGAHGGEDGFDVGGVVGLGLVEDQQMVGRFAAGGRAGVAADEDDRGAAERVAARPARPPPAAACPGGVEPLLQPSHAPAQPVADRAVDDLAAVALEDGQQVDQQMGDGLVFARLAGEDEEEFAAAAIEYRVDDGAQGFDLVGVEGHADEDAREGGDVGQEVVGGTHGN